MSDKQVVQEISTGLFDSGTDLFRNTLLISATCTIAAVVLGLCFDAVRRIRQRLKVDQNKGESKCNLHVACKKVLHLGFSARSEGARVGN